MLASASRYFNKIFKEHADDPANDGEKDEKLKGMSKRKLPKVSMPDPFPTDSGKGLGKPAEDPVLKILKYIYSNQNIYKIKDEITDSNLFSLYAQAHACKMSQLLKDLRTLAINELLN